MDPTQVPNILDQLQQPMPAPAAPAIQMPAAPAPAPAEGPGMLQQLASAAGQVYSALPGVDRLQQVEQNFANQPSAADLASIYAPQVAVSTQQGPATTPVDVKETTMPRTPGLDVAMQDEAARVASDRARMDKSVAALDANSAAAEKAGQEHYGKLQADAEEAKAKNLRIEQDIEKYRAEMYQQRADMAKIKPEDFWSDSSTGQQVAMSLAIMAGGIAGGMNRTGQNPAMVTLQNAINNDMQKYAAKLQAANAGIDASGKLIDAATKQGEQVKLGYLMHKEQLGEMLKGTLDSLARSANNETAKANIMKLQADLSQTQEKNRLDVERAIAGSVERTYQVKQMLSNVTPESHDALKAYTPAQQETILSAVAQNREATAQARGVDPATLPAYSLPPKGSEAQKTALKALAGSEKELFTINKIESELASSNPQEFAKLRQALDKVMSQMPSADKGVGLGSLINLGVSREEFNSLIGNNAADIMERAVPGKGGDYWRAMSAVVQNMARDVSGAAIGPSEFVAEMRKIAPMPQLSVDGLRNAVAARQGWIDMQKNILDPQGAQRAPSILPPPKK